MGREQARHLSSARRTMIFVNLVVSGIASSTLSTAMNTALPDVTAYFGVDASIGQWVTSGYSLAMGVVMPLTAFLITRFPTRRLYMAGIGCFIAGLLLSIFANGFALMMVGRVLQACGNGVLMSAAQVVILTVYPLERRGAMMGTYGLATTAAPIIAPTVAGLMIDAFGWKSIFWLALAIMACSLVCSAFVFDDVLELQDKRFDVVSFVESVVAFGGVTLGVGNIGAYGLASVEAGLPLLVGAAVCVLFVVRQCGMDKPFLDVRILANRSYAVSVAASMVLYLVMMGSSVMMPLYVQSVMGYSAVVSGLVTLPGSLATALVSPFAGQLYDRMGIRRIFIVGAAALVASNAGMCLLTLDSPLWIAAALNVVRNVAIGSLMMPLLTWGTSNVDQSKVADASSLLTSLRTIAGSIGSAVFVGVMTAVAASSAERYGDGALMYGMNVSFLGMTAGALVLLAIAL
ncbi:DHA2 family efflux MFS transporter permease subunit [Bifidobacterium phasiani]|uniref:DHA2 family efflux MFS transporter permease subunit n=1 Tax=Bifidobacterium phasiani TaxID=2834431 RepID=A0ABS6W8W7_9BIFI|nr:DHA2 family efflux MFS transporter permease subunit [Bifidobacterium phasiani]MBW3082948.1 DHA2 family efflux MFS transporter permease subunit [Bifidobacterium phasiani]